MEENREEKHEERVEALKRRLEGHEEKHEDKSYLDQLLDEIESLIPKKVNYVTGIVVDDNLDVLVVKNGKVHVGKGLDDAVPVKQFINSDNVTYVMNALVIFKPMIPGYVETMWGEESEKKRSVDDVMKDIYG